MSAPNIPDDILSFARLHSELKIAQTGGGCDYVVRHAGGERPNWVVAVLGNPEDAGSPERLDGPATVTIYIDEEWMNGITFRFDSAEKAMLWMIVPQGCWWSGEKDVFADRDALLTLLKKADLGEHSTDERGPCKCSQCEWRRAARKLVGGKKSKETAAPPAKADYVRVLVEQDYDSVVRSLRSIRDALGDRPVIKGEAERALSVLGEDA